MSFIWDARENGGFGECIFGWENFLLYSSFIDIDS
jgi:hypothetical protein